jgi:hypothetical protein
LNRFGEKPNGLEQNEVEEERERRMLHQIQVHFYLACELSKIHVLDRNTFAEICDAFLSSSCFPLLQTCGKSEILELISMLLNYLCATLSSIYQDHRIDANESIEEEEQGIWCFLGIYINECGRLLNEKERVSMRARMTFQRIANDLQTFLG